MRGSVSMNDKERQRLIEEEARKYQREYMREYRSRPEFKEKQKKYRENWLLNRALKDLGDVDNL
jgi:hypothetical protein